MFIPTCSLLCSLRLGLSPKNGQPEEMLRDELKCWLQKWQPNNALVETFLGVVLFMCSSNICTLGFFRPPPQSLKMAGELLLFSITCEKIQYLVTEMFACMKSSATQLLTSLSLWSAPKAISVRTSLSSSLPCFSPPPPGPFSSLDLSHNTLLSVLVVLLMYVSFSQTVFCLKINNKANNESTAYTINQSKRERQTKLDFKDDITLLSSHDLDVGLRS